MKKFKFLIGFGLIALMSFNTYARIVSSHTSPKEDFSALNAGSCMVSISNQQTVRSINVLYIKYIEVDSSNPNVLVVATASNYGSYSAFKTTYSSPQEAQKAFIDLSKEINFCNYKQKRLYDEMMNQ